MTIETPRAPAPPPQALRFMVERRTLPAEAGFQCEYWVRPLTWAEPSDSSGEYTRALGMAFPGDSPTSPPDILGMAFPGDVWATVLINHRGEMEVEMVTAPWSFDTVDALSEFGSTLLECRDRASADILNWSGPKALVMPT